MVLRCQLVAVLLFFVAACGASPTTSPQADPTGAQAPAADIPATSTPDAGSPTAAAPTAGSSEMTGLETLYAEVEGLTGDERRERLISLAQEEGGELSLYTSQNLDDFGPIGAAFEAATGIVPMPYRAGADTVRQRVIAEAAAGQSSADVIQFHSLEMTILDREGLLAPLRSPTTENIMEEAVHDNFGGTWLNVFVAAWNTDAVPPGEAPQTWEDVLTNYGGRIALESTDWGWFGTLVTEHFVAEEGMTEEEAIALFAEAASGGSAHQGHTAMAELLVAGEFDIAPSLYIDRVTQMKGDGLPIEWQEPVQPLVILPDGIAISAHTQRPATALLYVEFMMTEGQQMLADAGLTPASPTLSGLSSYETLTMDLDAMLDEQDKWQTLYEEQVLTKVGNAP
ncbi:MAG TPA: extracellular solute-binding protein [Dermatophilaceae bacterium]|nr:extracellular solute-binding protein [Dermatophilaceae bacterium]